MHSSRYRCQENPHEVETPSVIHCSIRSLAADTSLAMSLSRHVVPTALGLALSSVYVGFRLREGDSMTPFDLSAVAAVFLAIEALSWAVRRIGLSWRAGDVNMLEVGSHGARGLYQEQVRLSYKLSHI